MAYDEKLKYPEGYNREKLMETVTELVTCKLKCEEIISIIDNDDKIKISWTLKNRVKSCDAILNDLLELTKIIFIPTAILELREKTDEYNIKPEDIKYEDFSRLIDQFDMDYNPQEMAELVNRSIKICKECHEEMDSLYNDLIAYKKAQEKIKEQKASEMSELKSLLLSEEASDQWWRFFLLFTYLSSYFLSKSSLVISIILGILGTLSYAVGDFHHKKSLMTSCITFIICYSSMYILTFIWMNDTSNVILKIIFVIFVLFINNFIYHALWQDNDD